MRKERFLTSEEQAILLNSLRRSVKIIKSLDFDEEDGIITKSDEKQKNRKKPSKT